VSPEIWLMMQLYVFTMPFAYPLPIIVNQQINLSMFVVSKFYPGIMRKGNYRDIAHDTLNMLQLSENADAEEAKAWLDEFIKLQTPFTVTSIRRGRWVE
jgi:hypothetical protein